MHEAVQVKAHPERSDGIWTLASARFWCEMPRGERTGGKDRVTIRPNSLVKPLRVQLVTAEQLHEQDLVDGYGTVYLPYALERKYPHANKEWSGCQASAPARFPRYATITRPAQ